MAANASLAQFFKSFSFTMDDWSLLTKIKYIPILFFFDFLNTSFCLLDLLFSHFQVVRLLHSLHQVNNEYFIDFGS